VAWPPEWAGLQAGLRPAPGGPPSALAGSAGLRRAHVLGITICL
jgi:hypothetical protein